MREGKNAARAAVQFAEVQYPAPFGPENCLGQTRAVEIPKRFVENILC
jgi:hypothetical protein